jgi:hypothetical protein
MWVEQLETNCSRRECVPCSSSLRRLRAALPFRVFTHLLTTCTCAKGERKDARKIERVISLFCTESERGRRERERQYAVVEESRKKEGIVRWG